MRALYELSKQLGVQRIIHRREPDASKVSDPLRYAPKHLPPAPVPPSVASRTLEEAAEIVEGRVWLFGRRLDVGHPPDWHAVLHAPGAWPRHPWWTIDIRSPRRAGDVKWVWELARHRHLVVLARAVHLDPRDARWREALRVQLESWLEANPPGTGVNWYSNLELGLRAVRWAEILALAGAHLPLPLRKQMGVHLRASLKQMLSELPYTLSTMRNNHLVGDLVGMAACARLCGSRRLAQLVDRMLVEFACRFVREDGSSTEDSISYQRFVLEQLCAWTLLTGRRDLVRRSLAIAGWLSRMGALEDPPPPFLGDDDDGRFLVGSPTEREVGSSARLAACLAGSGADVTWRNDGLLGWYVPEGEPANLPDAESAGDRVAPGIARVRVGETVVWLKGGGERSHTHADRCSVHAVVAGRLVSGDPGTGTYNGPAEVRDWFRSSRAHSVLLVEGEDQLVPHRTFRWLYDAQGDVGEPVHLRGGWRIVWGHHSAYLRQRPPREVVRAVTVCETFVVIGDWISGGGRPRWELEVVLPPGVPSSDVGLPDPLPEGWSEPEASHEALWSDRYGSWGPTSSLRLRGWGTGPVAWSVGDGRSLPTLEVCPGGTLVVGRRVELRVAWGATPRLVVTDRRDDLQIVLPIRGEPIRGEASAQS